MFGNIFGDVWAVHIEEGEVYGWRNEVGLVVDEAVGGNDSRNDYWDCEWRLVCHRMGCGAVYRTVSWVSGVVGANGMRDRVFEVSVQLNFCE
mmetsp:Transcript_4300/g.8518  ORF Transcript_4300/g.8518 Transcript_4300/m.8518 type:complete len:92 (-) Transcript_4300:158-433(-)